MRFEIEKNIERHKYVLYINEGEVAEADDYATLLQKMGVFLKAQFEVGEK